MVVNETVVYVVLVSNFTMRKTRLIAGVFTDETTAIAIANEYNNIGALGTLTFGIDAVVEPVTLNEHLFPFAPPTITFEKLLRNNEGTEGNPG